MSYLDKHIVQQIHDLESPLNERVSFEEVMNRRDKKKRRLFLFWPRIVVVGGLFTAAGLGYYVWNSPHGKATQQVAMASNKEISKEVIPQIESKNTTARKYQDQASPSANTATFSNSDNHKTRNENNKNSNWEQQSTPFLGKVVKPLRGRSESNAINREVDLTSNPPSLRPETPSINAISSIPEIQQPTLIEPVVGLVPVNQEIIASAEIQGEVSSEYFINIQRLAQLTHGLGLRLFEIPNPISESDFKDIFMELDGGNQQDYFRPGNFNSPYHVELSVGTGSRVLTNFDETLPVSVLGNQYNAHYQLSGLKDLSNGIQLALGISYGEWEGVGEWQKQQWNSYTVRDSSVLIGFPNPNDRQVIYFDSVITELTVTRGGINYQINKISLPLGFRKLMYVGKIPVRLAMQIAPGRTIKSAGYYFNDFEFHSIDNQRLTTLDMKMAVGPSLNIHRNFTMVLEPNANMQTFYDSRTNRVHSKSFWGFGFSLIRHFN